MSDYCRPSVGGRAERGAPPLLEGQDDRQAGSTFRLTEGADMPSRAVHRPDMVPERGCGSTDGMDGNGDREWGFSPGHRHLFFVAVDEWEAARSRISYVLECSVGYPSDNCGILSPYQIFVAVQDHEIVIETG